MKIQKFKRKNQKMKYNEANYIKKQYMVNGKAVIPVELKEIDDLFMKHDYKKLELSDEVSKYIEEIAYMIPMETDIVIEIHCEKVDKEKEESMRKTIRNNYGMEIDDIKYDIYKANIKSFFFGIMGILLLIINILTEEYIGEVLSNFICVIWWVAIWDVVELQVMEKSELKWKRLNYEQLYYSEITFEYDK